MQNPLRECSVLTDYVSSRPFPLFAFIDRPLTFQRQKLDDCVRLSCRCSQDLLDRAKVDLWEILGTLSLDFLLRKRQRPRIALDLEVADVGALE